MIERKFDIMSIYPSNLELVSRNPTFIEHMKRVQFVSWFPLSLSTTSFSKVSKVFLFISILHLLVNLLHLWLPVISLQWNESGPFSAALSTVMKIAQSSIPVVFIITALNKKSQFEETTKKFLSVLKVLGLWKYPMFRSCKVVLHLWGIGTLLIISQVIVSKWSDVSGTEKIIDNLLSAVYSSYLLSWEFQFFYTVRTIEACFFQLTQTAIANTTNLKQFFQLYNRLIEIAAETNEFYDFPVSVVLLLFLLVFIDYTGIALTEKNMSVMSKIDVYSEAFFVAALLICILRNCHAASDQANKSNEALLKYHVHHKNSVQHDNSLLMIHLCARQKLVFRACKSFAINYNLGISMVAAYVTYTIVLLQIDTTSTSPLNSLNATNLTTPKSDQ